MVIDWEVVEDNTMIYITYLEPEGKHTQLWSGKIIDPKHPQCFQCGRFVKVNWDRSYSGPCTVCYEDLRWL